MKSQSRTFAVILLICLGIPVRAADLAKNFTFDGYLLDSSNNPIAGPVSVTFKVTNPAGDCLLFEETHSSVSPAADGSISLKVGGGTRASVGVDGGLVFKTIFQNNGLIRATSTANCAPGYVPSNFDGRKLTVVVNSTTLTPAYDISPVPMATVAESLQGKVVSDFVMTTGVATMAGPLKLASQGQLQLMDTTTNYVGFRAPATVTTSRLYTLPAADGGTGDILSTNGSGTLSWISAGGGGGTVTSVTGTAPIVVGTGTTTPAISLASSGVTPGSYGGVSNTPNIAVDGYGRITSIVANPIAIDPNQILDGGATVGQVLKWDGAEWSPGTDDNSGGGGGITGISAFSSTGTTDGLSISGSTITLHGANSAYPGAVSVGAQSFAGAKTFIDVANFSASGTSLTVTNNMSVGGTITAADPTANAHLTTKQYVNSMLSTGLMKTGDTMTGALMMDNQMDIRFKEYAGNGANYVSIKAPASLAADYFLTLPADDGNTGQVLQTDGSGVLSWAGLPPAAWIFNASDIYFSGGRVGVGTSTPLAPLHVNSTLSDLAAVKINPTWNNAGGTYTGISMDILNTASGAASKLLDLKIGGTTKFTVDKNGAVWLQNGSAANPALVGQVSIDTGIYFPAAANMAISTSGAERLRIDPTGNVGIGTTTPAATLDVVGSLKVGNAISGGSSQPIQNMRHCTGASGSSVSNLTISGCSVPNGAVVTCSPDADLGGVMWSAFVNAGQIKINFSAAAPVPANWKCLVTN